MSRQHLSEGPHDAVVDGFTHGGEGVVRIDGKAVFVPATIPGERVRVRVVDDRRRWARAELLEVLESSDERTVPECEYVPECGGCDLQHVTVAGQLALKTRVVREQLERIGGIVEPPVAACRAVGPATGYRTQARLHADADGRLGFHRASSAEIVAVSRCLVISEGAQSVRDAVGDTSGARQASIRSLEGAGVAVLTPGTGPLRVEGIVDTDVLVAGSDGGTAALRGDGVLGITVAGLRFQVPPDAFFQSGPDAASALVDTVIAAAGGLEEGPVWDLYAGIGLLSLPLAANGGQVTAVEGNRAAADAAARNAEANGLQLAVHTSSVHAAVRGQGLTDPQLVVLDPPRQGAGEVVIEAVAARAPRRIVYVACDPAALARDAAALLARGYALRRAEPLDLFPMTHHVEVVATFERL